jgi:hypothetical protein
VATVALDLLGIERRLRRRCRGTAATGHRRDDAHRVARLHRSPFFFEIADVFVIQIDVDEATQPSIFVVKMLLQRLVFARQLRKQLADGGAFELDDITLSSEGPQRCGNVNLRGHFRS